MIACAAIKKGDKVYLGHRHNNIIEDQHYKGVSFKTEDCVQGFITGEGEFLNRQEAALHAFECKQLLKNVGTMYSEHICTYIKNIKAFVDMVNERAEKNILKTNKLEGAHKAAMDSVLQGLIDHTEEL